MIQRLPLRFVAVAPFVLAAAAIASHIPVLNEDAKILSSDGEAGDWFGHRVSLDGDTLGVAAYNGNQPDDRPAYVFQRNEDGVWVEVARLMYSDPPERRGFGQSVSLDGDAFVVSAWVDGDLGESAGAVYIFERGEDGVWAEAAKLHAPDGAAGDGFGESVSLDGDWLVAGTEYRDDLGQWSGAAYLFEREGTEWRAQAKLLAPDGQAFDYFGESVAIQGSTVVVGARGDDDRTLDAGAVYMFERGEDGSWVAKGKLFAPDAEAGDAFGADVAIDGDVLVVSSAGDDDQGNLSGSAYAFERGEDGSWVARAKLLSPHGRALDNFSFVAVSGETVVVGAEGGQSEPGLPAGTVDVFRRSDEGEWVNVVRLLASDPGFLDQLGLSVAIDGTTVVSGARLDDDQGEDSGSAYVFSLEGCLLRLRLAAQAVRAGEELRVGVSLEHKLAQTVTVPLRLSIEDAAGGEIASRTTPPLTFRHGETLRREVAVRIPEGTPPGRYRVLAGLEQMQQGRARAAEPFRVVDASVLPPRP